MIKFTPLFLILICLSFTGCAALFSAQEYVLIDQRITEHLEFHGNIYTIPEKAHIRKIVLHGTGQVKNYFVYYKHETDGWKLVENIRKRIEFPYEISLVAYTDSIRIEQRTIIGKGRLDSIALYTFAEKQE